MSFKVEGTGSHCLSSAATTLFPHTFPFFDIVFKYFPIRLGPALNTIRMSILCRAYEFGRKEVLVSHRTSPLEFENQPLLRNPVDFLASKANRAQQCRQAVPFLSPHSWLTCSGNPKAYPWKLMHPSSWLCISS